MIDPTRIMERLQRLLADCEREMESSDWRVRINVGATCYPNDGSGGMVTFSVGTKWEYDDDDE